MNLKTILALGIIFTSASLHSQVWTSSGSNAICTNAGSTRLVVKPDGTVWIGNGSGTQKSTDTILYVDGSMAAREIFVNMRNWPDYVFQPSYYLMSLEDVQIFIDSASHLPGVPNQLQVTSNGISVNDMNEIMIKKIEELQLYILQLNVRIKELENTVSK